MSCECTSTGLSHCWKGGWRSYLRCSLLCLSASACKGHCIIRSSDEIEYLNNVPAGGCLQGWYNAQGLQTNGQLSYNESRWSRPTDYPYRPSAVSTVGHDWHYMGESVRGVWVQRRKMRVGLSFSFTAHTPPRPTCPLLSGGTLSLNELRAV